MKWVIAALLAVPAFFFLRKLRAPRRGTERLAITVWAAFGRYEEAEAILLCRRTGEPLRQIRT
jgi:hypothetical protein